MTHTYKTLAKFLGFLGNVPALQYESWNAQYCKEEIFAALKRAKAEFATEMTALNFKELTEEELQLLRFGKWDADNLLVPMWLFQILPDETEMYCPLDGSECLRADADDDYRFGCSAYNLKVLQ